MNGQCENRVPGTDRVRPELSTAASVAPGTAIGRLLDRRHDPCWRQWRWQLAHAVTDPGLLSAWLGLCAKAGHQLEQAAARYPLRVTPHYLSLARSATLADPILRQCVPDRAELQDPDSAVPDPLGEERDNPVSGLVHRYRDRALLLVTNRCAVYCRHCMRKRCWTRPDRDLEATQFERARDYIAAHTEIREVILSGGEPLLLAGTRLEEMLATLHALPHVEIVRIGSRLPVVLPQRFSRDFCRRLGRHGPTWLATHFNHPLELNDDARSACANLLQAGIPVVNQTVLLGALNDDPDTLATLWRGLLRLGVKPYYLFHGDPVAGTMHFRTGLARGLQIMAALENRISGLALPVFAYDRTDGSGKVRLQPRPGPNRSGPRQQPHQPPAKTRPPTAGIDNSHPAL